MKFFLIFLITIIFMLGCMASRKSVLLTKSSRDVANMVTPNFEKIDARIALLIQNSIQVNWREKTLDLRGDYDTILSKYGSNKITIFNHENLIIKSIEYEVNTGNEKMLIDSITPYLSVYKDFYGNGNIKTKSVGSWLGFAIGKDYMFNKQGKLIKIRDNDMGYDFDDVISFCDKNNIRLKKGRLGEHIRISKKVYNGKLAWFIPGFHDVKNDKWLTLILDGKNGHIIAKDSTHVVIPE